jgi:hypothetical protein
MAGTPLSGAFLGTDTLLSPPESEAPAQSGGIGAGVIAISAVAGVVLLVCAVLAIVYLGPKCKNADGRRDHRSDSPTPPDTLHTTVLDYDELGTNTSTSTTTYGSPWKQFSGVVDDEY